MTAAETGSSVEPIMMVAENNNRNSGADYYSASHKNDYKFYSKTFVKEGSSDPAATTLVTKRSERKAKNHFDNVTKSLQVTMR